MLFNPLSDIQFYSGHQCNNVQTNQWNNSLSSPLLSGFLHGLLYLFLYLWGDLVLVLCPRTLWCNCLIEMTTGNPIDKRKCLRLEVTGSVEDCICCWNLNLFDVFLKMLFVVHFIAFLLYFRPFWRSSIHILDTTLITRLCLVLQYICVIICLYNQSFFFNPSFRILEICLRARENTILLVRVSHVE